MQSAFLESQHPAQPTNTHTSLTKQIRLLLLSTVSLQNKNEKLNCTKPPAFMVLGTSEKFLGQTLLNLKSPRLNQNLKSAPRFYKPPD